MYFAEEIIYCDEEYQALSETFRAQVTFQQFVSIKNPRWSKDEVALWAKKMEEVNYWSSIAKENRAKAVKEVDTSPHASRELCYSCKEPWEQDHRCRGKGRVHYIEVHYDSDEKDVYEDAALDASLEQSQDSCAFDGQSDDQGACEGADVFAPRHDEIQRLDDPPLGDDMTSREPCVGEEELPMELSVAQSLPSQTLMIDMTQEDISGILDVVEEPCVVFEHKGHMDLQTQEERHDLEPVDYIHTYQYGESESPLLGSPLIDQVGETDKLMGHLLSGPVYSDEDTFLVGRDDHITCMDTSVWDPGADDISRSECTGGYNCTYRIQWIQMEVALGDDVQWHTGGLSSTEDSGTVWCLIS
jgi:hypothetical protein